MTSFNFYCGKANVGCNLNFHYIEQQRQLTASIPTYEVSQLIPIHLQVLPMLVLPNSNDPKCQIIILDGNSNEKTEDRGVIATSEEVQTQLGGHCARINLNHSDNMSMKTEVSLCMYSNECSIPGSSNPLHSLSRTPSADNGMSLPPLPRFNIDFGTDCAKHLWQRRSVPVDKSEELKESPRKQQNKDRHEPNTEANENHNGPQKKCASNLNHRGANADNNSSNNNNDNNDDNNNNKRYMCMYCHKELFNSTGLKHHVYTHTHQWPFRCNWAGCAKGTATKRDLLKHYRTHTGERPFECDICNKKFTQSGVMHRHKKVCWKKNVNNTNWPFMK